MANPFKDAESKGKVRPGGKPKVDPPAPAPVPVEPEVEETPTVVGKDFLAKFVEPKPEGKSYSFYLSNEAAKNLERLAKQLKCSKSKALDILLKNAVN